MAEVLEREEETIVTRAGKLLGRRTTFKRELRSRLDAHEVIESGFPGGALLRLAESVALFRRPEAFEQALGISSRTLQQCRKEPSRCSARRRKLTRFSSGPRAGSISVGRSSCLLCLQEPNSSKPISNGSNTAFTHDSASRSPWVGEDSCMAVQSKAVCPHLG